MAFTFFLTGFKPGLSESALRGVLRQDMPVDLYLKASPEGGLVAKVGVPSVEYAKQAITAVSESPLMGRSVVAVARDTAEGLKLATLFRVPHDGTDLNACAQHSLSTVCVLVVDDDDVGLAGMQELVSIGLPETCVHVANSAVDAMKLNEVLEFAAILSDVQMPVMDGVRLVAEIKRLHPHTPVLLMTGDTRASSAMAGSAAFAFMRKPVDRHACWRALGHAIQFYQMGKAIVRATARREDCACATVELIQLAERERAESLLQWT
jgi:CheY-like chemotaxis protein